MIFNMFLYGFIVWALLSANSYDYEPHTNGEGTIYNNTNKDNK